MSTPIQAGPNLAARRNLTICVLDSDPSQLAATKTSLDRAGFPTIAAAHPQDALEKIRLGGCRVVLADCKLSGIDGIAFIEKALEKSPAVHVLLMSATHSVDAAIEAIKHGAHDFLCKPLDYPRLMKTLDEIAAHLEKPQPSGVSAGENWRPLPLSEMRRLHIERVLETCNGNRVRAARMLGIGRTSLYRFLKSSDKQSAASMRV
jgi:DNA-binding NtrC family response regulator